LAGRACNSFTGIQRKETNNAYPSVNDVMV
jgi:hypothetical protein